MMHRADIALRMRTVRRMTIALRRAAVLRMRMRRTAAAARMLTAVRQAIGSRTAIARRMLTARRTAIAVGIHTAIRTIQGAAARIAAYTTRPKPQQDLKPHTPARWTHTGAATFLQGMTADCRLAERIGLHKGSSASSLTANQPRGRAGEYAVLPQA